jgi:hypothetical protein
VASWYCSTASAFGKYGFSGRAEDADVGGVGSCIIRALLDFLLLPLVKRAFGVVDLPLVYAFRLRRERPIPRVRRMASEMKRYALLVAGVFVVA